MAIWLLKTLIQKGFSALPGGYRLNTAAQRTMRKGDWLSDEYFFNRLAHGFTHLGYYEQYSSGKIPTRCLEIGTGWHPIVPITLFLAGVDSIQTFDHQPHLTLRNLNETVRKFLSVLKSNISGVGNRFLPERIDKLSRWAEQDFATLREGLSDLHIEYSPNGLAVLPSFEGGSDYIISNNTLSNIREQDLPVILKDCLNRMRPDGLMSHFIDMTDQNSHWDSGIGPFNYLRFSNRQWRLLTGRINYQNRLRLPSFVQVFDALGMQQLVCEVNQETLEALDRQKLHPDFLVFNRLELRISHAHLVYGVQILQQKWKTK